MLAQLLDSLATLTSSVYAGTVIVFALLLALYPRVTGRPHSEVAGVWRSAGPVLGISMGLWILGMVGGRYLEHGQVGWSWDSVEAQVDLARWALFAVLWASSFVLEIWTNEPLRTAVDDSGEVLDPAAFMAGYRRVAAHLAVNAVLVATWLAVKP